MFNLLDLDKLLVSPKFTWVYVCTSVIAALPRKLPVEIMYSVVHAYVTMKV